MMTHDEMIAVIQAHKDGLKIEYKLSSYQDGLWIPVSSPVWDFKEVEYRIAKTVPRKLWQWIYKNGDNVAMSIFFYYTKEDAQKNVGPKSLACVIGPALWTEIEEPQ